MVGDFGAQGNQPSLSLVQFLAPPTKGIGNEVQHGLRYSSESPAWHCDISRSGKWLAACFGAPDPRIQIWGQGRTKWEFHSTLDGIHSKSIRSVAFAPISSTEVLAAASFDGSVSIWEYDTQRKEWECTTQLEGHESEVKCVTWNCTGSLLATSGRDKTVWIWETFLDGSVGGSSDNDFECISVLSGHEGDVKIVRFAESHGQWGDGDEILISAGYDDTIRVWAEDAGDWYCAMVIEEIHSDTIWTLAVSPGSGRIISASADGSIAILRNYTIAERRKLFPNDKSSFSYVPLLRWVVVLRLLFRELNSLLFCYNASFRNGYWKCVGKLLAAHSSTVYSIDYAPAKAGHGRIASCGGDNRLQIYREAIGSTSAKPLFSLEVSQETDHGDVNCICWHPWDGSLLCSAGDDGSVRIWHYQL